MSSRFQLIASILFLLSSATLAQAADPAPSSETCVTRERTVRLAGHPGKSFARPQRKQTVVTCAAPDRKPLMLAAFVDARGGKALVARRTNAALEKLGNLRQASPRELTNLCVAHTLQHQWTEAQDACDAAVASAMDVSARARTRFSMDRRAADAGLAAAYSNRAVMSLLSSNGLAAQADLARARKAAPYAGYVKRNSLQAQNASSLAQVSANAWADALLN